MDLFAMLKKDHDEVKKVLGALVGSTGRATKSRQSGFQKLQELLIPHMVAEEEMFYPIIIQESQAEKGYQAMEEHRAARAVLSDLKELDFGDDKWHARCQVLAELLEHHIEEEESDIFEAARDVIDDERSQKLAKQFQAKKEEAQQQV
jgi:hemerythrin-like domain-containing protein